MQQSVGGAVLLRKFLFSFLILISGFAKAAEYYEPFKSVRQMGMGGVYIFNGSDANSFLVNPAYSCYAEGINWSIFDLHVGVGDVQVYRDLTAATGSLPEPSGFADLGPYFGKNLHLDLGGYSSLMLPCLGISGYYTGVMEFKVSNPAFPKLKTYYMDDNGVVLGGALPLTSFFSLGFAFKRVDRHGGPVNYSAESLVDLEGTDGIKELVASNKNRGIGYGVDVGVVSRLSALPFNPTVSAAWKDLGSMSFTKTAGTSAPERQKDNLVLGATIDGSIPFLGLAAGVEYRHITDNNEQLGKKLHAGVEVTLGMMDFRAGINQGYITYGAGLDLWLVQLDAAYYKVEKGAYPGQTPEERIQVGLLMDISFDPSFKFLDAGGRTRRLKQRR